ncbi:GNAT family N-acetyltransferase [Heyndrickxia acidicola]|uniref:GNAT family protein n=1 Tax=Heyndrickxia acidicola TaxID=209389 RepID=A0ABU6MM88_9BACI|nr:GNAT family protein [Heyndrickxia acidicola]MED1205795.1 GNAT family protein [Heyndrickxia acidicola]
MFSFKVDEKIEIQLFQQEHKNELFSLIDKNREHLRKWLLWVDKRQSPEGLEPVISAWLTNYANNNGFDGGIRYNGTLVGMIGLHYIDWKNRATSIGYLLAENAQGKGIMTKTVRALANYLFEKLNLNRIEIQAAVNNVKSLAIPRRLGFTEEGIKREGQWLYDHYEDLILFSMLKSDWKQLK